MSSHERMNIVYLSVEDLVPLVDNPRIITDDGISRLRDSIKTLGFFKPSLFWTEPDSGTRYIIGGNQRHAVLTLLHQQGSLPFVVEFSNGKTVEVTNELPCVEFFGSRAEARAVALRDNKEDGDWDWDSLPGFTDELFQDLQEIGRTNVSALTGFSEETLRDLAFLANDATVRLSKLKVEEDDHASGEVTMKADHAEPNVTAGFVCGGLRGRIRHETAERFLMIFNGAADACGSDKMDDALNFLLDRMTP